MLKQHVFWLSLLLLLLGLPTQAQELPSCSARPLIAELPRVESRLWCLERAIFEHEAGELAFTAIEFAPDGALYATRPLTGELYVMRDSDGDNLPDSPTVVATGMRFPNGLIYAENALYIMGDGHIYRFTDDILETIVADLPGGRGFMASGITYHEGWLYVGVPMPCDFCAPEADLHGTVVRLALDGSQREVIARGLRYPAGLTVWDGTLWVTDTGRDGARGIQGTDELNRIDLNSDTIPHFGFPYCEGMANVSNFPGDFDCATVTMPAVTLYTHSTPLALQPYSGAAFRFLQGDLLLVLGGSVNNAAVRGYQVAYLEYEQDNLVIETMLPHDSLIAGVDRVPYNPTNGYVPLFAQMLNRRGAGVWPHRIFDVAISPEGWIYMSVGGGQIFVLRPGNTDPCSYRTCTDE
jgi:glucose/arabinose dehydrogenase